MEKEKIKLLIAIPTLDYIHYKFVESLTGLVKNLEQNGLDFDVAFEGCTLVYISRDNLVKKAMDGHYTHVLWLDADMVFEPDIFWKLLDTDKNIISGMCRGRHNSMRPCLFKKLVPAVRYEDFPKGLVQIEGCGFGGVLTRIEPLRMVMNEYNTCFTPMDDFGEDLAFCKRALDMGFSIWTTDQVKMGHIAQVIIETDKPSNPI